MIRFGAAAKFAATCRWVDVVAAGNDVLAGVARPAARAVEILPTSIDTSCYRATTAAPGRPAHHRLDRQSGESGLSGNDPARIGAAQRALSHAQSPGDLLRVSGLAGDPGGARALERRPPRPPRSPPRTSA